MPISKPANTPCISALVFQLFVLVFAAQVWPLSSAAQNTYTSPIDITGMKLQVRAFAPNRDSGVPFEIPLPPGILANMTPLLATPLSSQFDQKWSPLRQQACENIKPIVAKRISDTKIPVLGSISAYDIQCTFQSTGKLFVQGKGTVLLLAYQLTGNKINMYVATHATCHPGHGLPGCPIDPHFTVTFMLQITTIISMDDLCQIVVSPPTVTTHSPQIDGSDNFTGAIVQAADDLISGSEHFTAAEQAIKAMQTTYPVSLADSFSQLTNSDGCQNKNPVLSSALKAFSNLEAVIEPLPVTTNPPTGILLRVTHRGIQTPVLDANGSLPSTPSFNRPAISTAVPTVAPGANLSIQGLHFPPSVDHSHLLPMGFAHPGYAGSKLLNIGKGACYGGATELQVTPANGQPNIERIPGDANGNCISSYDVKNLIPGTAYQFRARDCDPITVVPGRHPRKHPLTPPLGTKELSLSPSTVAVPGVVANLKALPANPPPARRSALPL